MRFFHNLDPFKKLAHALILSATLVSCSQGGKPAPDAPDDLGVRPDFGREFDLAMPADLAPLPPIGHLAPIWARSLQGVAISWGPYIQVGPPPEASSDPQIVMAFTKGSASENLTVGYGDPGQTDIVGRFKPVIAWVDGRDGRIQHVRQVATDPRPDSSAVSPQAGIAVTPAGETLIGGQFHGTTVFNSGTVAAQTHTAVSITGSWQADDPFFGRYGQDATPSWLWRGRTPGPLTRNWYNYGQALAALPDGGALLAGRLDGPGFVLADGTPGAKTFSASEGSYLARVDDKGNLTWVARHTGHVEFPNGVRAGADGSAYLLSYFEKDATLFADSAQPVSLVAQAGRYSFVIVKLTPTGAVAWVRRMLFSQGSLPGESVVTAAGRLVVVGTLRGKVEILSDGDHVDATYEAATQDGYVASWDSDGKFGWFTRLDPQISDAYQIAEQKDGTVWVTAWTGPETRALPMDDGSSVMLPDIGLPTGAMVNLVYRISPTGKRITADILGVNLRISQIASRGDVLSITGVNGDWIKDNRVGPPGAMTNLPDCQKDKEMLLFWAAMRLK